MFSSWHSDLWRGVDGWIEQPGQREEPADFSLERASVDGIAARLAAIDPRKPAPLLDLRARSLAAKQARFGGKVFAISPLYVTSFCAENCVYCNYRAANAAVEIERRRLTPEELEREALFLIREKGLHVLELVYSSDPHLGVDRMCQDVETTRELLERHGGGIVGINCEALEEAEYRQLVNAGLAFAVLWQETYDAARYRQVHPAGAKKARFEYRLDAPERMIAAGLRAIGLGVLSGLAEWRRDWIMLMVHEAYLARTCGCAPAIVGVPRLKPAAGAQHVADGRTPDDATFEALVALHNVFAPQVAPFVNTREPWTLCTRLARGGGCLFTFNCATIPGGHSLGTRGYQFPTDSFDSQVYASKLEEQGLDAVFDWTFDPLRGPVPRGTFE